MVLECPSTMPEIGSIIEEVGFGWAQVSQLLVGGGIWASDSAELVIIGAITRSLAEEWHISGNARGTAASIIFVGMGMGALLSGPIGDHSGRRGAVLASYTGVIVFGCLSACAMNLIQIIICRVLVGIFIGIGQPSWNALINEMSPKAWSSHAVCFSMCIFTLGECYAVMLLYLDDPEMKELNWRRLLVQGAMLPLVLLIVAYFFFRESPKFLAVQGDTEGAKKVLRWMGKCNGKPDVDVDFASAPDGQTARPTSHDWVTPLKIVFGRWMLPTTVLFGFSAFVLNSVFYGGLYAYPQVLPTMKMYLSPVVVLMMGIAIEMPGYITGASMMYRLSKRTAMATYIFLNMVGQLPYASLVDGTSDGVLPGDGTGEASALTQFLLVAGMVVLKLSNAQGWIVIYTGVAKAYPTAARATGSSVCISSGRLGAVTAPLVYEVIVKWCDRPQGYFVFMCLLCMINLMLVFLVKDPVGKDSAEIENVAASGPSYC